MANKDVHEVLDQKERELLQLRMDLLALYRVIPILAEASDAPHNLQQEMPHS